ncbi:hypothetical protein AN639_00245 [Candidatus Epulonipiscium fishelsonii]|uniref:Uncharacterized protein n=1 Tax=Candidatus Epulonipiscium fishelsonii TaxID=77094 RepID=A0ACC8XER2_9FIRM|nr:hypothetical protein AN396_00565 [Epulopiscium sp. SCG-B11WGA-EpuloA1]ONI43954.1 hypothetical protein AN639_00245 [Epulopiscium sp. SCG-B05WGA-EpuloA1]
MSYIAFDKVVEIAVVGVSNAGKSTFIGALYHSNICNKLRKKALTNKGQGQTKILVHYQLDRQLDRIERSDTLEIAAIKWNEDKIISILTNKESAKSLCSSLGFDEAVIEGKLDEDNLKELLEEAETILKYEDIDTIFDNYINNKELQQAGIISCIVLSGSPSEAINNIMSNYGFEKIVLRDTRGLLDGDLKRQVTNELNEENPSTSEVETIDQVAERGLIGVNACILMNGNNATMTESTAELYDAIFNAIANKMPTFLVEKSITLLRELEMGKDYYNALKDPDVTDYSFEHMEEILKKYDFSKDSSPLTISQELIQRHFKKMLLADIAKSMEKLDHSEENTEKYIQRYNLYIYTVNAVMGEVLKALSALRETIRDAFNIFKDHKMTIMYGFLTCYKNEFLSSIRMWGAPSCVRLDSKIVENDCTSNIAKKIVGYIDYYGEMVGIRGGLTSYRDYKYEAIAILKTATCCINKILGGLINDEEVAKSLIQCIGNIFYDDAQKKLAIGTIYITLSNYHQNGYTEYLQSTGTIVHRSNLWNACETERDKGIGKTHYYAIFNTFSDKFPNIKKQDKLALSIVYGVVFNILKNFIATVNDVTIKDEDLEKILFNEIN